MKTFKSYEPGPFTSHHPHTIDGTIKSLREVKKLMKQESDICIESIFIQRLVPCFLDTSGLLGKKVEYYQSGYSLEIKVRVKFQNIPQPHLPK